MAVSSWARIGINPVDTKTLAASIAREQLPSGEIPWHKGGVTDPWDHIEAAIGLSIGGYFAETRHAFEWLATIQLGDGSWYSEYKDGEPTDRKRQSHHAAYLVVGVMYYFIITRDRVFLERIWPTVSAGIDYAVSLQGSEGQIYWMRDAEDRIDQMSLLTASSSIFMSLRCGLALATILGESRLRWQEALRQLETAIRFNRHLFEQSKSRYSMDWFYPVLCGALTHKEAHERIEQLWDTFVVDGLGVRCVSDRPWITMAETSELVMALASIGRRDQAEMALRWIVDRKYDDGNYHCGFVFPEMTVWPEEKLTWTNAVVMMAADVLYQITPAPQLLGQCLRGRGENGVFYSREHAISDFSSK